MRFRILALSGFAACCAPAAFSHGDHDAPPLPLAPPRAGTGVAACVVTGAADGDSGAGARKDRCPARAFAADPDPAPYEGVAADGFPPLAPALHGPLSGAPGESALDGGGFLAGAAAREAEDGLEFPSAGGALHGRIGWFAAPATWAAGSPALERDGHGNFNLPGPDEQTGLEFSLAGGARGGRLDYFAAYAPRWTVRRWVTGRDTLNDQRDFVAPGSIAPEGRLAPVLENRFRAGFAWRPAPAHELRFAAWGAPSSADGPLRAGAQRTRASADVGITAAPARRGAPDSDPRQGVTGSLRVRDEGTALSWRWTPGRWRIEARAGRRRRSVSERPDPPAMAAGYNDIRRSQVYAMQSFAGLPPVVSPSQYRFGGFGLYQAEAALESDGADFSVVRRFAFGGTHDLSISAAGERRVIRENLGRSGPQGEDGPVVALRSLYGRPIGSSMIRLRHGYTAQAQCARVYPAAGDLLSACPATVYQINRARLNPDAPGARVRQTRLALRDEWTRGRWRLDAAVRRDQVRLDDPNRYALRNDFNGGVLTGSDGWPVGSRNEDVLVNPSSPAPPEYTAAPGVFVAGSYRFPAEWSWRLAGRRDALGGERLALGAALQSAADPLEDELAEHAFENGFGLASAQFTYPDLTGQYGASVTYGGGTALVAPRTRLGRTDRFALSASGRAGRLAWSLSLDHAELRRFLGHTQANWVEAVMNRTYDFYVMNDARYGTRYCMNCARGQTSLFPEFPPLYLGGDPNRINPEARFLLSETLANPGVNTLPGRFPEPTRRETRLRAALELPLDAAARITLHAGIALARTRGNSAGNFPSRNGLDHPELTSQYAYPLSPLTAASYRSGDLEGAYGGDSPPSAAAEFALADAELGDGWSGVLRGRWERGRPRTPLLAPPGTQRDGTLPGDAADYYWLDLDLDGNPDKLILRSYRALGRGAGGRTPDLYALDARAAWRRRLPRGEFEFFLEVDNLLNRTAVMRYDDRLERGVGLLAPGADSRLADPRFPDHEEPATDPTLRSANPTAGDPLQAQTGRRGRVGVAWFF